MATDAASPVPVVAVSDLAFSYVSGGRRRRVLSDVSFTIERGEFVAIQGPSGSGKSTLFYLLGCLLRPTEGEVRLNGACLTGLGDDAAAVLRNREIGFVFQQFHLLARASVLDNVMLPCRYPTELPSRADRARKDQALALATRLGLDGHLANRPNELSGGQQQRVAIARALIGDPSLILADEPTGNLDSTSAAEIMTIFDELNAKGKTIVIITHDPEIARRARRVLHVRDGAIVADERRAPEPGATDAALTAAPPLAAPAPKARRETRPRLPRGWSPDPFRLAFAAFPSALRNLARNRAKSALTMLGVIIGVGAVLAMMTLGQFAKARILEGFEALGVNKLVVRGYGNWDRKAVDEVRAQFQAFDWARDLVPIRRIFPQIGLISPVLTSWNNSAMLGGKTVSDGVRLLGVNHEYLAISNAHLAEGHMFSPYHVESGTPVCVIGAEVADTLLPATERLGQVLTIAVNEQNSFPCRVIGILTPQKSAQEWFRPNLQVLIPYTAFQFAGNYWDTQIHEFAFQVRSESQVETTAAQVKGFFERKYGKAGKFTVDTEGTLVAQTKRFLTMFAALLAAIAFLSLLVGGIGIHNMMLVSVAERLKEIGLRKALGATRRSMRMQVLVESTLLCVLAGLIGIGAGIAATEGLLYAATKLVKDLPFQWVLDPWALGVSVISIVTVGIASGLVPALRAERLEVIDALRAE